jgi:hypothetical protein
LGASEAKLSKVLFCWSRNSAIAFVAWENFTLCKIVMTPTILTHCDVRKGEDDVCVIVNVVCHTIIDALFLFSIKFDDPCGGDGQSLISSIPCQ